MWTALQQAAYVAKAVRAAGLNRFEVKKSCRMLSTRASRNAWRMPIRPDTCSSYYLDAAGRNQFVWPEFGMVIKRRLHHFEIADYEVR